MEFADRQRELVGRPRWMVEGNYASTLPIRLAAADTVIFLDLPAATCLLGIFQRRWRYCRGQHANDGVFDRIAISFVRYSWGYRRIMRPKVQRLLTEHGDQARLTTVTSRRQSAHFVRGLWAVAQAQTWARAFRGPALMSLGPGTQVRVCGRWSPCAWRLPRARSGTASGMRPAVAGVA